MIFFIKIHINQYRFYKEYSLFNYLKILKITLYPGLMQEALIVNTKSSVVIFSSFTLKKNNKK